MKALLATLIAMAVVIPLRGDSQPDKGGQKPTFTGGVDLVTLNVVVQNRNGRPVVGLSRGDFEVLDGGEPRAIADFRSDVTPISVAVLFDQSGSMGIAAKLADGRAAVRHLMSWLEPGRDEAALYVFDTRLLELQGFTTTPADVSARLDAIHPFGATSLYDAITATGRKLAAEGGARRAVFVVTDGTDTSSRLTAQEASNIASKIDVPVYILVVRSPLDHPGTETAVDPSDHLLTGSLHDLAAWTGGSLFVASAPSHASVAARQIVTELRQQYLIAFEPSSRAGWHPLAVRTRDNKLVVRARSGYIAGPRAVDPN